MYPIKYIYKSPTDQKKNKNKSPQDPLYKHVQYLFLCWLLIGLVLHVIILKQEIIVLDYITQAFGSCSANMGDWDNSIMSLWGFGGS